MERMTEYEHQKQIIARTAKTPYEYEVRIKALIERLGI
jgi:hypothetical protein